MFKGEAKQEARDITASQVRRILDNLPVEQVTSLSIEETSEAVAPEYFELPKTIKRWCCQGKSCGNTELQLVTHHFDYSDVDMHMYVRASNGMPYGDGTWRRTENMRQWLKFTENNVNPEVE
jgi:hypothetical protein